MVLFLVTTTEGKRFYIYNMANIWQTFSLAKKTVAQKVEAKRSDEDRKCDGRTALREVWKELEENREQQQKLEGIGDCLQGT